MNGKEKLIVYGIGRHFSNVVVRQLQRGNMLDTFLERVIALSDSNACRWGEVVYGREIIDPARIATFDGSIVLIATTMKLFDEIAEMLVNTYNISVKSIIWLDEYVFSLFVSESGMSFPSGFAIIPPSLKMDALTTHKILSLAKAKPFSVPYDIPLRITYSKLIKKGDTVVDVGAHDGLHTIEFDKLIGCEGALFAFEPLPCKYKVLREKFAYPHVRVLNCALSCDTGEVDFYEYPEALALSGLKARSTYKYDTVIESKPVAIKIQSIKLDSFIDEFNSLDYIKIDCEGAELSVIKGGLKVIERFRPIMSVEYGYGSYSYYSLTKNSLYELCDALGYFITDVFGNIIPTLALWEKLCDTIYWDYFLVPKEKMDFFWERVHSEEMHEAYTVAK